MWHIMLLFCTVHSSESRGYTLQLVKLFIFEEPFTLETNTKKILPDIKAIFILFGNMCELEQRLCVKKAKFLTFETYLRHISPCFIHKSWSIWDYKIVLMHLQSLSSFLCKVISKFSVHIASKCHSTQFSCLWILLSNRSLLHKNIRKLSIIVLTHLS